MRSQKVSNRIPVEVLRADCPQKRRIVFCVFPTPFLLSELVLGGFSILCLSLSLSFSLSLFLSLSFQLSLIFYSLSAVTRRQTTTNGFFRPLGKTTLIASTLLWRLLPKSGTFRREKAKSVVLAE